MEEELEEELEDELEKELEDELEEEDILSLLLTSTKLLFFMICKGVDMLILSFFSYSFFNLSSIYSFILYHFSMIC
jgi:hypothetical protein